MIYAPWPAPVVVTYPVLELGPGALQEATDDEVRAYHEKLRQILEESDQLTGQALERTRDLVNDMQDSVLGKLTRIQQQGQFKAFWLPWMDHAVQTVSADFAKKYGKEIEGFLPAAWGLGLKTADATLDRPAALPVLNMQQVGISAQLHPQLITGIDEETRKIIGREVALGVNTGENPHDIMKRLALPLEHQQSPFRKVAYRTEIVTRTEVARHEDLAAAARMEQAQALDPERQLWWTMLVAEVNGWPCPQCSAIAADGPWKVGDPRGPLLPIHPNCRCKRVIYVPKVEKVNVPTAAQRDASVADSKAPSKETVAGAASSGPMTEEPEPPARVPPSPDLNASVKQAEQPSKTESMQPESGSRITRTQAPEKYQQRVPQGEVSKVWDLCKPAIDNGELHPWMEREDVELASAYMFMNPSAGRPIWEYILKGGDLGLSLLKHELAEIQWYEKREIDFFSPSEQIASYAQAHGHALLAEKDHLLLVATRMRYTFKEEGSLIRYSPIPNEGRTAAEIEEDDFGQADFDKAKKSKPSLRYNEDDKPAVEKFFRHLKRLQNQ